MKPIPHTRFSTRLSGSARETEGRLRSLLRGGKKRPPAALLILLVLLIRKKTTNRRKHRHSSIFCNINGIWIKTSNKATTFMNLFQHRIQFI